MIKTIEVHYQSENEKYLVYSKAINLISDFLNKLGINDSGAVSSTGGIVENKADYIFTFIITVKDDADEKNIIRKFNEHKPQNNTIKLLDGVTITFYNLDVFNEEDEDDIEYLEVPRKNLDIFISKESEEYEFPFCIHFDTAKDYEFVNKKGSQIDLYALDPDLTLEERNGKIIKDKDKYIGTCKIKEITRVEDKLNLGHRVIMVRLDIYSKVNIFKEKCLSIDGVITHKDKDDKILINIEFLYLVDSYKAKLTNAEILLGKELTFKTIFPDLTMADNKEKVESRGNNLSGIIG